MAQPRQPDKGSGSSDAPPQPKTWATVRLESQGAWAFMDRLRNSCFNKCIPEWHDGEVSVGEGVCLDNCMYKYWQVMQETRPIIDEGSVAASYYYDNRRTGNWLGRPVTVRLHFNSEQESVTSPCLAFKTQAAPRQST
eukprot:g37272.t1